MPAADWAAPGVRDLVPDAMKEARRVPLVPTWRGEILLEREGGTWGATKAIARLDWPVMGISTLAAIEYAHWKSRTDPDGWHYRLPTDLEWEKAARGVDGRRYVWGDDPVWTYCRGLLSAASEKNRLGPAGTHPIDRSVYGIHDLAGSVSELTSDATIPGQRFTSQRGGTWYTADEYRFEIATRFGRLADRGGIDCGFRLVVEIPRPE